MLRLIQYNIKVKVKSFNTIFWPLFFPILLGTMYYFSFGSAAESDFKTVPVALVEEAGADSVFLQFLDAVESEEGHLIEIRRMGNEEAKTALTDRAVSGIYYAGDTLSLTVGGNGISESILQSLLENYEKSRQTLERVMEVHPEGVAQAAASMDNYEELVEQVSLGGKTTDGTVQFFYALIAMACLYGAFIGLGSALDIQANLTPLGARRSVTPTNKLKIIIADMISSFLLHFLNVMILLVYLRYVLSLDFKGEMGSMVLVSLIGCIIGVSMGIFIGSFGKMGEGVKVAILLAVSMVSSFLAGLMMNTMKDVVERTAPFLNRINPAALITDAFYCINVYDDSQRYMRSLLILSGMAVLLLAASFLSIRRERYDSI